MPLPPEVKQALLARFNAERGNMTPEQRRLLTIINRKNGIEDGGASGSWGDDTAPVQEPVRTPLGTTKTGVPVYAGDPAHEVALRRQAARKGVVPATAYGDPNAKEYSWGKRAAAMGRGAIEYAGGLPVAAMEQMLDVASNPIGTTDSAGIEDMRRRFANTFNVPVAGQATMEGPYPEQGRVGVGDLLYPVRMAGKLAEMDYDARQRMKAEADAQMGGDAYDTSHAIRTKALATVPFLGAMTDVMLEGLESPDPEMFWRTVGSPFGLALANKFHLSRKQGPGLAAEMQTKGMRKAGLSVVDAPPVRSMGIDKAEALEKLITDEVLPDGTVRPAPMRSLMDQPGGAVSATRGSLERKIVQGKKAAMSDQAAVMEAGGTTPVDTSAARANLRNRMQALSDGTGRTRTVEIGGVEYEIPIGKRRFADQEIENLLREEIELSRVTDAQSAHDLHVTYGEKAANKKAYDHELGRARRITEDEPEHAMVQAQGELARALEESLPDISDPNRRIHGFSKLMDTVSRFPAGAASTDRIGRWLFTKFGAAGGIGLTATGVGAAAGSAILAAGALVDLARLVGRSTLRRTAWGQMQYNLGKLLASGKFDDVAKAANAASDMIRAEEAVNQAEAKVNPGAFFLPKRYRTPDIPGPATVDPAAQAAQQAARRQGTALTPDLGILGDTQTTFGAGGAATTPVLASREDLAAAGVAGGMRGGATGTSNTSGPTGGGSGPVGGGPASSVATDVPTTQFGQTKGQILDEILKAERAGDYDTSDALREFYVAEFGEEVPVHQGGWQPGSGDVRGLLEGDVLPDPEAIRNSDLFAEPIVLHAADDTTGPIDTVLGPDGVYTPTNAGPPPRRVEIPRTPMLPSREQAQALLPGLSPTSPELIERGAGGGIPMSAVPPTSPNLVERTNPMPFYGQTERGGIPLPGKKGRGARRTSAGKPTADFPQALPTRPAETTAVVPDRASLEAAPAEVVNSTNPVAAAEKTAAAAKPIKRLKRLSPAQLKKLTPEESDAIVDRIANLTNEKALLSRQYDQYRQRGMHAEAQATGRRMNEIAVELADSYQDINEFETEYLLSHGNTGVTKLPGKGRKGAEKGMAGKTEAPKQEAAPAAATEAEVEAETPAPAPRVTRVGPETAVDIDADPVRIRDVEQPKNPQKILDEINELIPFGMKIKVRGVEGTVSGRSVKTIQIDIPDPDNPGNILKNQYPTETVLEALRPDTIESLTSQINQIDAVLPKLEGEVLADLQKGRATLVAALEKLKADQPIVSKTALEPAKGSFPAEAPPEGPVTIAEQKSKRAGQNVSTETVALSEDQKQKLTLVSKGHGQWEVRDHTQGNKVVFTGNRKQAREKATKILMERKGKGQVEVEAASPEVPSRESIIDDGPKGKAIDVKAGTPDTPTAPPAPASNVPPLTQFIRNLQKSGADVAEAGKVSRTGPTGGIPKEVSGGWRIGPLKLHTSPVADSGGAMRITYGGSGTEIVAGPKKINTLADLESLHAEATTQLEKAVVPTDKFVAAVKEAFDAEARLTGGGRVKLKDVLEHVKGKLGLNDWQVKYNMDLARQSQGADRLPFVLETGSQAEGPKLNVSLNNLDAADTPKSFAYMREIKSAPESKPAPTAIRKAESPDVVNERNREVIQAQIDRKQERLDMLEEKFNRTTDHRLLDTMFEKIDSLQVEIAGLEDELAKIPKAGKKVETPAPAPAPAPASAPAEVSAPAPQEPAKSAGVVPEREQTVKQESKPKSAPAEKAKKETKKQSPQAPRQASKPAESPTPSRIKSREEVLADEKEQVQRAYGETKEERAKNQVDEFFKKQTTEKSHRGGPRGRRAGKIDDLHLPELKGLKEGDTVQVYVGPPGGRAEVEYGVVKADKGTYYEVSTFKSKTLAPGTSTGVKNIRYNRVEKF